MQSDTGKLHEAVDKILVTDCPRFEAFATEVYCRARVGKKVGVKSMQDHMASEGIKMSREEVKEFLKTIRMRCS